MIILVVAICIITYVIIGITAGTVFLHRQGSAYDDIAGIVGMVWPIALLVLLVMGAFWYPYKLGSRLHQFELNYLRNKK